MFDEVAVNYVPCLSGHDFNRVGSAAPITTGRGRRVPPADLHRGRGQPLHGQVEVGGQGGPQPSESGGKRRVCRIWKRIGEIVFADSIRCNRRRICTRSTQKRARASDQWIG